MSTDTEHHSKINQHIEKLAKELNDPYLLQVAKEYDFGSDNVNSGQGTIAFNLVTYLSSEQQNIRLINHRENYSSFYLSYLFYML